MCTWYLLLLIATSHATVCILQFTYLISQLGTPRMLPMPTAKKPRWKECLCTCLNSSFNLAMVSLLVLGTSVIFFYVNSSFSFHCSLYGTFLWKCWISCKYFETRPYYIPPDWPWKCDSAASVSQVLGLQCVCHHTLSLSQSVSVSGSGSLSVLVSFYLCLSLCLCLWLSLYPTS